MGQVARLVHNIIYCHMKSNWQGTMMCVDMVQLSTLSIMCPFQYTYLDFVTLVPAFVVLRTSEPQNHSIHISYHYNQEQITTSIDVL